MVFVLVATILDMEVKKIEYVNIKITMDTAYKLLSELNLIEDLENDTALMELLESLDLIL